MKLIPKYLTAWGKLTYNGPQFYEIEEALKREDPQAYNRLQIESARSKSPNSEIIYYTDAEGKPRTTTSVIGMSAADPVGEFVVGNAVLNPIFKAAGTGILYGAGRLGNKTARAKLISRAMTPSKTIVPSTIVQTEILHSPKVNVPLGKTSLKMLERPSKTTMKETLGLTKGERFGNNLPRTESDAVRDFTDYYTSGKNKKYFIFKDGEYKWVDKPDKTAEGGVAHMLNTDGSITRGFIRAPYQNGVVSKGFDNNLISFSSGFPSDWGVASNYALGRYSRNIILTSPKIDFKNSFVPETPEDEIIMKNTLDKLSNVIDKNIVKNYWKVSSLITQPGLYTSGDAGDLPLGFNLMQALDKKGHLSDVSKALLKGEAKGLSRRRYGLSVDSYMSLLKQGNRPGNNLSFNMEDGFGRFNDSGVYNKHIYDLWKKAYDGEIPKEVFLEEFRKWVEPYGGRPAFLSKKNKKIIIPHPFVFKKKQGGKL